MLVSTLAAVALAGAAQPPARADLLVSSVAIVSPEQGTVSPPSDILVADGRIAAIAPAGTIDPDDAATVVDGRGLYALPGLIDVHAHVGDGGAGSQTQADRDAAMRQFLRYGVTSIFVPGGSGANDAELGAWRRRCAAGAVACPGVYGSGSLITAAGSHPITTLFGLPADADPATLEAVGLAALAPDGDAAALVADRVAAGADAIKIVIEDGPPPWYPKPRLTDAQVAALAAAAHRHGRPVYAHVGRAEHVAVGLAGGIDGIMHAPIDPMPGAMLAAMAEDGVVFVATLALFDGLADWASGEAEADPFALAGITPRAAATLKDPAFLAEAPPGEAAAAWLAAASDNLRRAAAAGVPLALGTDTNNPFVYPGYAAHEELALMVAAGLTPAEALAAATTGGAAFLGKPQTLGRLAKGYEADMLILTANPLADIEATRAIATVISDGEVVVEAVSAR